MMIELRDGSLIENATIRAAGFGEHGIQLMVQGDTALNDGHRMTVGEWFDETDLRVITFDRDTR